MEPQVTFDEPAAHRHFSKSCFNRAWDLIEKADRSEDEDEEMIRLNQASLWHWTRRPDCSDRNLSVGYWQASRIRAVLGHAAEARRYADLAERYSRALSPFYQAAAQEALARAAVVEGDRGAAEAHAMRARTLAQAIVDVDERELVLADLETLDR